MTTAEIDKIIPAEYEVKCREIERLWNIFSTTGKDLDRVILEARTILENSGYSRTEAMKIIFLIKTRKQNMVSSSTKTD